MLPTFLLLYVSGRRRDGGNGAAVQCGGPLGLTPPPRYYPHNVVPRDLAGGHNVRIARAALLAAVEEDGVVIVIFSPLYDYCFSRLSLRLLSGKV